MGTSTEQMESRSGDFNTDVIPWQCVSHEVRHELILLLNPPRTLEGNDWKMLAGKLGYTGKQVLFIESEKNSNTAELFKQYDHKPGSSLNEIYDSLVQMKREDCLQVIEKYLPAIKEDYWRELNGNVPVLIGSGPVSYAESCHYNHSMVNSIQHQSQHALSCRSRGVLSPSHNGRCMSPYHNFSMDSHRSAMAYQWGQAAGECESHMYSLCQKCCPRHSTTDQFNGRETSLPRNITVGDNSNVCGEVHAAAHRLKVSRQYSADSTCENSNSRDKRARHSSADRASYASSVEDCNASLDENVLVSKPAEHYSSRTNAQGSPLGGGSVPIAKSSLEEMKKLSNMPEKYQPTTEYKNIVVNQKVEPLKEICGELNCQDSDVSSSYSGKTMDNPRTFPMRIKSKAANPLEDSMNTLTISRSPSMPMNMKPSEFRLAWKDIKILVTYSKGSSQQGKQVLSLCKFLQANEFCFCNDVSDYPQTFNMAELTRRFYIADFVLVCVSPNYLKEISEETPVVDEANKPRLHAREIYQLMKQEYERSLYTVSDNVSSNGPRFIPLFFDEDIRQSALPPCLRSSPSYKWPKEYLDLAWLLTKPHERIKNKSFNHQTH